MNNLQQAAKQALETLEVSRRSHLYCEDPWYSCPKHEDGCANELDGDECNCGADEANQKIDQAIAALRAALNLPEQEPVGCILAEQLSKMFHRLEGIDQNQWGYPWKKGWNDALRQAMDYCQTAPTPRKPLTDEEIWNTYKNLWMFHPAEEPRLAGDVLKFARAIERAHGIGEQHE